MAKTKSVFFCTECGYETPKWMGRCPGCGAYNTMQEHIEKPATPGRAKSAPVGISRQPQQLSQVNSGDELRFSTGMGELDRVLGGGAVAGSLVLVGGAPGIGKSTLLLQICNSLCQGRSVLYVSGEESERQLKLRAERLQVNPNGLYILSETRLSDILEAVEQFKPDILIVDSIQTLYNEVSESAPGSISQVKDCTMALLQLSKSEGLTVFVVGHINKDGNIAGPKVLEHMVDCVMYFEGDPNTSYRLLRAAKNRFGSTNEIGVFEMNSSGLQEIPNPSAALLSGRPENTPGSCIVCAMEGTRPVLSEVQALCTSSAFGNPRRMATGLDLGRIIMLLAVIEKRANLRLSAYDAYVNIVGGIRLNEPAIDLGAVLSIASSFKNSPIDSSVVAIGEVGLTGEIRSTPFLEARIKEAEKMGFTKCIIPAANLDKLPDFKKIKLFPFDNIKDAINSFIK